MYPCDFEPTLKGLNPEEIFVVMPFAAKYEPVFTDLVEPAVSLSGRVFGRVLKTYRTKGDRRTTSGWLEVLEHLFTAQVVLGVLTRRVNANVQYELGIAHAIQPIRRQILIAEGHYKPSFDTKDLIFLQYSPTSPANSVNQLAERIQTAITEWDVEQEKIVSHAIAKITPFEFEVVMQWFHTDHFSVRTSGSGPDDYKKVVWFTSTTHGTWTGSLRDTAKPLDAFNTAGFLALTLVLIRRKSNSHTTGQISEILSLSVSVSLMEPKGRVDMV